MPVRSGIEIFRRELRELGYIESKNIIIEVRSAKDELERLRELTDELLRLDVDALVVPSTAGTLVARGYQKFEIPKQYR